MHQIPIGDGIHDPIDSFTSLWYPHWILGTWGNCSCLLAPCARASWIVAPPQTLQVTCQHKWPAMGLPEKWISSLIGTLFFVHHFGFPGPDRLQRPPSFLNCKVYFRVSSSCIFWSCPCAAGARLDRQTVVSFLFWFLFPCFRKLFCFFAFHFFFCFSTLLFGLSAFLLPRFMTQPRMCRPVPFLLLPKKVAEPAVEHILCTCCFF